MKSACRPIASQAPIAERLAELGAVVDQREPDPAALRGHEAIVDLILLGAAVYYLVFLLPMRKSHWILHDPNEAAEELSS